jgi:DNA-binding transcriptional ArsR family regulator
VVPFGASGVDKANHWKYSSKRLNIVDAVQTRLDDTLMALADPTRRAILKRLAEGEARVTEIARPFEMSLNAVSKHIRVLERANLVRRRRAGREHFLRVNPPALDEAAAWIAAQRALWTSRLDVLDAILKAEDEASVASAPPDLQLDKDGHE